MRSIIVPWSRQPQTPTKADRNNTYGAIADGIYIAGLDADRGNVYTPRVQIPRSDQVGFNFRGDYANYDTKIPIRSKWSMVFRLRPLSRSGFDYFFGVPGLTWGLAHSNYLGGNNVMIYDGFGARDSGLLVDVSVDATLGVSFDGTNATFHKNGVAGNTVAITNASGTWSFCALAGASSSNSLLIYGMAVFNGVLKAADHISLHNNFYQILAPQRKILPSASGGSLTYTLSNPTMALSGGNWYPKVTETVA